MDNKRPNFALKKAKSDEWFTPKEAVIPIIKYLKPKSIIWCPFDTNKSNFVKVLKDNNFKVINTHIFNDEDFFKIEIPICDYIISNPPYSKRNEILNKLFNLRKPFAMLMNTNGLFDSRIRWNLFKNNNFTLIYLKGRTTFSSENKIEKSSPPFQSAFICGFLLNKQIIFENRYKSK